MLVIKDDIVERLAIARKDRKLTVTQLSEILNISKEKIYKWERHIASPKFSDRQIIEDWLKNGNWKNVPCETDAWVSKQEFDELKKRVEALTAINEVFLAEIASLRAEASGEAVSVVMKRLAKAAL